MKTFAVKEKRPAPATVGRKPYVHAPFGPAQRAQQTRIGRILRSTGTQARLTIGQPGDRYEQEADRVADQVMAMPNPKLQRQPENEEEEGTSLERTSPERAPQPVQSPSQQLGSCSVPSRYNTVINPIDPDTVPSPRPRESGVLGITHLFIRGRNIKQVLQSGDIDALVDLVFPRIRTDWSLEWGGKRCRLIRPSPASTDRGTYSRLSIPTAGPWRRTIDISQLNDIMGYTPESCVGVTGRTRLVVGGHPSVAELLRAIRGDEMQHAADQERAVCRHLRAYETAVRALPSSFLTGLLTGCEEEAERRTGSRRRDRLAAFNSQLRNESNRLDYSGRHTHDKINLNIRRGCSRIEYDLVAHPRIGGFILP